MAPRRPSPFRRALRRIGFILLGTVLLAYPLDWTVWRLLMFMGHGMGTADVLETTAATLKGNHFEVYEQQTTTVDCSESVLPEAGAGPCWWLRRHPDVVKQY